MSSRARHLVVCLVGGCSRHRFVGGSSRPLSADSDLPTRHKVRIRNPAGQWPDRQTVWALKLRIGTFWADPRFGSELCRRNCQDPNLCGDASSPLEPNQKSDCNLRGSPTFGSEFRPSAEVRIRTLVPLAPYAKTVVSERWAAQQTPPGLIRAFPRHRSSDPSFAISLPRKKVRIRTFSAH
jgi:hypothetical protein